jgi:Tfp pilus assembly protein PilN
MIRINLLPKEISKKAAMRKKVLMVAGIIVLFIALLAGNYLMKVAKLTGLNGDIDKIEAELKKLAPVVQKVNTIKAQKEALNNKINVINTLLESRLLYPKFMERFSSELPISVWLVTLNTTVIPGGLKLDFGVLARDNYAVADTINILENSKYYHNIEFTGLATTTGGPDKTSVRSFNLKCNYYSSGEAPKEAPASAKKTSKKKKRKRRR